MVGGKPKHVVGYMKDFLFAPEQARTPVEVLSGGERGRLMLARALAKPSNLLVLDEPTNDLDLETLDLLAGNARRLSRAPSIVVSHDRDFLDRVVTSVIVPEGDGTLDRICRRLYRHAGPARRRREARDGEGRRREERGAVGAHASGATKRRLTFNEKHALETLPKTIAKLQSEIAKQQRFLDDPDLFRKDRKRFDQASDALTKAQKELAEAEDKWLELEVLREEIEQA